jgi:hypothetical protein
MTLRKCTRHFLENDFYTYEVPLAISSHLDETDRLGKKLMATTT